MRDSSFQNTCEYLAMAAGVFMLYLLGHNHLVYDIVGDSMSSLKWSRTGYTKSVIARNASIGLSLLAIRIDATLNKTTHIPGKVNVTCDTLSRHPLAQIEELVGVPRLSLQHAERIREFLSACDPTQEPISGVDQHIILLQNFLRILS